MREVAHANGAAADLVLIGGANAAPRGADLPRAGRIFPQAVEVAVDGQDQWAGLGNAQQIGGHLDPLVADALDLRLECPRIEDNAVADHRWRAAYDPARQQRKLVG